MIGLGARFLLEAATSTLLLSFGTTHSSPIFIAKSHSVTTGVMDGDGNQMGALMYRCPTTFHHVKTAIDTEPARLARMRNIKISVSCPHCIEGHSIPASEMYFEGMPSWPAAALSQLEIALTLASSDATPVAK
jgi:hypothetical protein